VTSTTTTTTTAKTVIDSDPYVRTADKILEPPKGWRPSVKFLGPGMVTSAAVVGSGELITATALGAEVGFILLWIILVSTVVKVGVQIELARWTISTGKASVTGYNDVAPKIFGKSWMSWLGLLNFSQGIIGQGGVLGAGAFAFSAAWPVIGEPLSASSLAFWVILMVAVTIAIHMTNKYAVVERISTVLVVLVAGSVVALVIGLQFTAFSWTLMDIGEGMSFQISVGAMGFALAVFGFTGIGADEITKYTYWCVEKGYAAWAGPNDGSDAWVSRAKGWISVMKKDAWLSWVIYTVATVSFYILGASVLHPQGLKPEGTDVITTLSRTFTDTLGPWAQTFFLVGAGVALLKTVLANTPGFARQMTNTLAMFGAFHWEDAKARDRWIRGFMIGLPIVWGAFALALKAPLTMVLIAGTINAFWLMAIVIAVIYLGRTQTDKRLRDGWKFNVYFVISAIAVFAVGVMSLLDETQIALEGREAAATSRPSIPRCPSTRKKIETMVDASQFAINCSLALKDVPERERAARARALGFEAVEFWWPFADQEPQPRQVEVFVEDVLRADVETTLLNFPGGGPSVGDRGLLCVPGREKALLQAARTTVDIGRRLGVTRFNPMVGNTTGEWSQESEGFETAVRNLVRISPIIGEADGLIVLEPLSGFPDAALKTFAEARELVLAARAEGAENVAILFDLYHAAVNVDEVLQVPARDADLIGHVQIADAPGRGWPGTGTLPLGRWLGSIRSAGYTGRVGLECLGPRPLDELEL
jgi:hydroxypyruvate isomerase/Mn2+/Fe2+ NRAMP family transporter